MQNRSNFNTCLLAVIVVVLLGGTLCACAALFFVPIRS